MTKFKIGDKVIVTNIMKFGRGNNSISTLITGYVGKITDNTIKSTSFRGEIWYYVDGYGGIIGKNLELKFTTWRNHYGGGK